MTNEILLKIKSVMIGHAVGDALGVPVEFCSRNELDTGPVDDMEGFGTYPYPAGCWSDDTSMSLAALDSLSKGDVDWDEIMLNFRKWLEEDAYTPTGECFDSGRTCVKAILSYFAYGNSVQTCGQTGEHSNGNGSLMRIHPFVLFTEYGEYLGNWLDIIHQASALTHAHERSVIACGIYAILLRQLLTAPNKQSIQVALDIAKEKYSKYTEFGHYQRIFESDFTQTRRSEIKSTGYVVDTLEAAVWCLLTTDTYSECVLKAVNLGDDTDTVAAIAGGLAGALYGYESIPEEWRNTLVRRDYIEEMCERAWQQWRANSQ